MNLTAVLVSQLPDPRIALGAEREKRAHIVQATIKYNVSETIQAELALATGQPAPRVQTMSVDLTEDNAHYFSFTADGIPFLDLTDSNKTVYVEPLKKTGHVSGYGASFVFDLANPDVIGLIKCGQGLIDAENAEKQRRRREQTMDVLTGRKTTNRSDSHYEGNLRISYAVRQAAWPYDGDQEVMNSPEAKAWLAELTLENEAVIANARASALKAKADAELKEAEKTAYITKWVTEHCDADTVQQLSDGLLCRKAALKLMADSVLDPIGPEITYRICQDQKCPCGSTNLDCLPRSVYPAWKTMRDRIPAGFTANFQSFRECLRDEDEDCDGGDDSDETAGPKVYAVNLKVPVGPFILERLVAIQ
jgi:hypothetical protein